MKNSTFIKKENDIAEYEIIDTFEGNEKKYESELIQKKSIFMPQKIK